MIALSVKQPWADLIAQGIKRIEVRTWATRHRGDLLIVASKAPVVDWIDAAGAEHRLPAGAHVCIARLVDCRPLTRADLAATCLEPADWQPGLHAWVLDRIRPVTPTPQRGYAAIYHVDDTLIRAA